MKIIIFTIYILLVVGVTSVDRLPDSDSAHSQGSRGRGGDPELLEGLLARAAFNLALALFTRRTSAWAMRKCTTSLGEEVVRICIQTYIPMCMRVSVWIDID